MHDAAPRDFVANVGTAQIHHRRADDPCTAGDKRALGQRPVTLNEAVALIVEQNYAPCPRCFPTYAPPARAAVRPSR